MKTAAVSIAQLQAEHLAAFEAFEAARIATHAARVKVAELQAKEAAAADVLANAEKALAAAAENSAEG